MGALEFRPSHGPNALSQTVIKPGYILLEKTRVSLPVTLPANHVQ